MKNQRKETKTRNKRMNKEENKTVDRRHSERKTKEDKDEEEIVQNDDKVDKEEEEPVKEAKMNVILILYYTEITVLVTSTVSILLRLKSLQGEQITSQWVLGNNGKVLATL